MASFARQDRGKSQIAAQTRFSAAASSRPATPSRNLQSAQEEPLDKDALVIFAIKATAALREESSSLAKRPRPNPFFAILSSYLSDVEGRLNNSASLTASRVSQLLVDLERLAKWPTPFEAPPINPYNQSSYPRLVLVLGGKLQRARICIKNVAEDPRERAIEDRKKFQKSFKAFANVKREPRGPELSDLTKSTSKPVLNDDDTTQCLRKLYSTLCQLCRCTDDVGGGDFKANIAVDEVLQSTGTDDGVTVDSFFLHRHLTGNRKTGEWKEIGIRVFLDRSDTGNSTSESKGLRFAQTGKKISDFCRLIRSQEPGRLKLSASNSGLFDDGIELPKRNRICLQAPSVPLARVLTSASLNKDSQRKLLLSYLLAKAVWQFYGSDWMAEGWTKDKVQFMRQRLDKLERKALLNHLPFISAELRTSALGLNSASHQEAPSSQEQDATTETPRQTHIFPKILALGIMLLEIELGEGIEKRHPIEFLDADGRPRTNAGHITAGGFIKSEEWKRTEVYQAVRESIEICVRPDTAKLGTDPARVRESLYIHVVAKLGTLFGLAYDCDGCPEKFDPGPMNFEPSDGLSDTVFMLDQVDMQDTRQTPDVPPLLQHFAEGPRLLPAVTAASHQVQGGDSELETVVMDVEDCELFGEEGQEPPDPKKCTETNRWVTAFKTLRVKLGVGRGRVERIRVAILDTGIDMNHPDVKSQRKRVIEHESFVGGDATVDTSGHGTHIAGILLDLTNNVDLYIGKFTETRLCGERENVMVRNNIVQALQRARTGWHVHMISLSFGFSKTGTPDKIQKEIEKCLNDGIIVFASASNDGGNRPRTYPGNYDRVLCIHSATGVGDASTFNPTPEDTKKDNFSTVGECVKSYWPLKDQDAPDAASKKYKYMSGTSFATPVAVSIAAFMVGYIQKEMPDYAWNVEPLSPEGMRTIFRMMSSQRTEYDWISPEWFFNRYNEGKIKEDLAQELRAKRKEPLKNP